MKNITNFGALTALFGCLLCFAACSVQGIPTGLVGPAILLGCIGALTVWLAELGGSRSSLARAATGVSLYTMAHCSWLGNWQANLMLLASLAMVFAAARPIRATLTR